MKILLLITILIIAVSVKAQSIRNEMDSTKVDSTQSLSRIFDSDQYKVGAVRVKTSFKGSALTIYTSADTVTAHFKQVYYDGNEVSVAVTKDKWLGLQPVEINQLLRYNKFKSDSAQTTSGGEYIYIDKTTF